MPEGTLIGAGANEAVKEGTAERAVQGGTGRYAGARGIMKLTQLPPQDGRSVWVAVEINLYA